MKKSVDNLFNYLFKPTCPLCHKDYTEENLPIIICPNQHECCSECMQQVVLKDQSFLKKIKKKVICTFQDCKQIVYNRQQKENVFQKIFQFKGNIIKMFQIDEYNSTRKFIIDQNVNQKAEELFLKAQQSFLNRNFSCCLQLCKQLIILKPLGWNNFKCLGHPAQLWLCNKAAYIQFYRWHIQANKQRSAYDLLNLCFSVQNTYQIDEQWLLDQLQLKIVGIQLYMGLGILHYRNNNREKAIFFFQMVCKFNNENDGYFQASAFNYFLRPFFTHQAGYGSQSSSSVYSSFTSYQYQYLQKDYDLYFKEIDQKQSRKYRLLKAKTKLEQLFKLNPKHIPLYYSLGKTQFYFQEYQNAVQNLQKYIKYVRPQTLNEVKTKFYLAYSYLMLPEMISSKLQTIISYLNDYKDYWTKKQEDFHYEVVWMNASICLQKGEFDEARKHIEKYQKIIIQLNSYSSSNDIRRAMSTFVWSMMDPKIYKYQLLMAQIYDKENNFEESVYHYERCLQANKNDLRALDQLSYLYFKHNQLQKIVQIYNKRQNKYSLLDLVKKFGKRNKQDFIDILIKFLQMSSTYSKDVQILQFLCQKLIQRQRQQQALQWARKWEVIQPKSSRLFNLFVKIYTKLGQKNQTQGQPRKIIHIE